jgi:predicted dienelactone hydrolase
MLHRLPMFRGLLAVFGAALASSGLLVWPSFSQAASDPVAESDANPVGMAFRSFVPKGPYDWRGARTHALSVVMWYPAQATVREKSVVVPGLDIFELGRAATDAPLASSPARFPLVVISHGTGGSALSMAWLGEALAAHGYIAAAVNHPGNNAGEPYTAAGFSIWWERARDLSETISGMLADGKFGGHIDRQRIGAAGFSLGGYTMIEIAGGITDVDRFVRFCDSTHDPGTCTSPPEFPTLVEDFRKMIHEHPEVLKKSGDSYRDPRVRAVFAIAPPLGPAFPASSLQGISIPVQIVAGESDQNVPIALNAKYFAAQISGAKLHIFPGNVAHYAFLDSCTARGRKTVPMLCIDRQGVDRDAIHAETVRMAVQFFRVTLHMPNR